MARSVVAPQPPLPPRGNGLHKPLDSSLRRAATGFLPSRRIQDFLSINDGGGWGQEFGRNSKGAVRMATHLFPPRRHLWTHLQDVGGRAAPACGLPAAGRQAGRAQAAEAAPIPLLWRGARQGGVVEPRLEPAAKEGGGGFRPAPACSRQAGMTALQACFRKMT